MNAMWILWAYLFGILPSFWVAARLVSKILNWDVTDGTDFFLTFVNALWIALLWPVVLLLGILFLGGVNKAARTALLNNTPGDLDGLMKHELVQMVVDLRSELDKRTNLEIKQLADEYGAKRSRRLIKRKAAANVVPR